jgi:hypothetical protein
MPATDMAAETKGSIRIRGKVIAAGLPEMA